MYCVFMSHSNILKDKGIVFCQVVEQRAFMLQGMGLNSGCDFLTVTNAFVTVKNQQDLTRKTCWTNSS